MPGKKGPGRRNHAKGASKGLRWAKGQSCVSNPNTRKFRDAASSQFLHPVSENPLLTTKNVAAVQAEADMSDMEEDLLSDVGSLTISEGSAGSLDSISTLRSLSSAWSKCSTNAFDRFLKKFRSTSLVHKEMLSILAASSEVIDNAGGKLNDTEFFATFLTFLDSCQPDQYQPVMSLLCIIISRVSPAVLRLRFENIHPKIGTILSYAAEKNDELLIRTSMEAVMKLIQAQNKLNLEEDKQLQGIIFTLLKCSLHERPRVRKKARGVVRKLVSQNQNRSTKCILKVVLGWTLDQLSWFPTCETKVVADVLGLLLNLWPSVSSISKPGAKKLFESVLRVMSSGDASIMKIGLSFITEVFQNFSAVTECDPQDELFSKLIVATWELQPDTRNTDCYVLWLRCILTGLVRLRQGSSEFDMSYLSSSLESSSQLLITSRGQTISDTYKEFFPHLITETMSKSVLEKCFRILSKNLLTVPPNLFALQILEALLENLTPAMYCQTARDIFLQLIPLRNAQGVSSAMGKFIWAFGVEEIWKSVDPATRWLVVLPLLNEHLHNAEIDFWKKEILPGLGSKVKVEIGWAAFVGFCRNPKDPTNFPAELVGRTIAERPEIRLLVLAALRQFVEWGQCGEIVKKYSKNFLPILFNLFINTKSDTANLKGHSDSLGSTIEKYLQHCDHEFLIELANRAIHKLSNEVIETGSPVFDLVAFLAKEVPDKELQDKILDTTVKKWVKLKDDKRAYRVLTSLSKNAKLNEEVLSKLTETLKQTSATTKSNAAALRLECMSVITGINPEWLNDFIPEVIINLLSVNVKAKKLAATYVQKYAKHIKETNNFEKAIQIIQVGLSSTIPLMITCTLRFAFCVYKEFTPESFNQPILQKCIEILQSNTDPVTLKCCLLFITLHLQLFKGMMGPVASQLGSIVSDPKFFRKDSTKLLARMIKVFGAFGVQNNLPNPEDPKMRNRIKNICKRLRAKAKSREDKIDDEDGNDFESDEEDDDMNMDVGMTNKTPLVMKEGVVDFLNPSDVAKSFINEQRASKQEEPFKVNEDGKLIIKVDSKKRKLEDSSDSEEEEQPAGDDKELRNKSRKRMHKSSASSVRSGRSKYSVKSFNSASTRKSTGSSKQKSQQVNIGKGNGMQKKLSKGKKFKSSSSVKSSKSGKSRKTSAASTFRLKL